MGLGKYLKERKAKKIAKKIEGTMLSSASVNNLYEEDDNEGMNPMFDSVEESTMDELHAGPASIYDKQEEVKESAEVTIPQTDGASDLEKLYKALNESEKGGRKGRSNSNKFYMVSSSLLELNNALKENSFGHADAYEDVKSVMKVSELYADLLKWCDVYLDRSAFSGAGKARQDIVTQIKTLAEKDATGIGKVMDEIGGASKESRAALTWSSLLKEARTEKFKTDKLESSSTGQASEVYKFRDHSVVDENGKEKLMFFKPETSFDMNENPTMWALQKYRQLYPDEEIKKPELNKFKKGKLDAEGNIGIPDKKGVITSNPEVKHPDTLKAFANMAYTNNEAFFKPGGMSGKGKQDITGRNVATSRVADLLGVGSLVVRSKFAEVDEKGSKRRGVVMEGASGISAEEYSVGMRNEIKKNKKLVADRKKEARENGTEYKQTGFLRTEESLNKHQGANEFTTPKLLKEITNLQVLDVICGQADRHSGNMFFTTDKDNRITGVQGIDNDGAFFMNEKALSHNSITRRDRDIYNDDGDLTLPHIDGEMADRVLALNPEALKFALCDILDEDTIKAAINRLNKVKQAIGNAKKGQILRGEEWNNPKVRDDLMRGITDEDRSAFRSENDRIKAEEKKKWLSQYGVDSERELESSDRAKFNKYVENVISPAGEQRYRDHEAGTSYLNFIHDMRNMHQR